MKPPRPKFCVVHSPTSLVGVRCSPERRMNSTDNTVNLAPPCGKLTARECKHLLAVVIIADESVDKKD